MVACFKITIADTGQQFDCQPDDTISRAALRAGIGVPYECNVGACGSCKIELLDGEVASNWPEAPALTDRDRARRRVLGCQSRPASDCTVKIRLGNHYASSIRPQRFAAVLTSFHDVTHDIREFRFQPEAPLAFLAGQYALINCAGFNGPRAYSMSNTAHTDGSWHFQIKRVPGGVGSSILFDRLLPGDTVTIDGPYGLAYLRTDSPRDIVCIAGGSGLAPMVSIARGAAVDPAMAGRKVHFFYGGRCARDICGEKMLSALPGFGARFFFHPVVSMPESDSSVPWSGRVGFVHEAVQEVMGQSLGDHEIYFAGPPAMAQAVQQLLAQNAVPREQVHYDAFY
jgi:toluene monooxygenase electron transfer component